MHTRAARDLVLRRPRVLDEVLLGVFALVQHAVFVDRTLLVGLSARVAGNYSKFFELARNWLRWGCAIASGTEISYRIQMEKRVNCGARGLLRERGPGVQSCD